MSGHKRARISRALIGVLIVTIALGTMFYLHNPRRIEAGSGPYEAQTARKAAPPPALIERPVEAALAEPRVEVTQTPAVAAGPVASPPPPATLPVQPLAHAPPLLMSPTTRNTDIPPPSAVNPIEDGKAKIAAGDLVGGRKVLNDFLLAGKLAPADETTVKSLIAQANDAIIFSSRKFASDPFAGTHAVPTGGRLATIAFAHDLTWNFLARLNGISDPRKLRAGQELKILHGPFHAIVDKSDFTLEVYLGTPGTPGSMFVRSFRVGLGKDDSTPAGVWMVGQKLKDPTYHSPRGQGIIEPHDPRNPLGAYWIGLTGIDGQAMGKESYGIHGTIEPNSIGKMESMGCIRLLNEDVTLVFEMLVEGKSLVTIRE